MTARVTPQWLNSKRRRRLYDVGAAGMLLLAGYGVLSAEHALLWCGLGAAFCGLARDNV